MVLQSVLMSGGLSSIINVKGLDFLEKRQTSTLTTIFMFMFLAHRANVSRGKHRKEWIQAAIHKCQCFNDAPAVHTKLRQAHV